MCSDVLTIEQRLEGYSAAAFSVFHLLSLSLSLPLFLSLAVSLTLSLFLTHFLSLAWVCVNVYEPFLWNVSTHTDKAIGCFFFLHFFAKRGV